MMVQKQKGFTLVEIAIVLVIVGLLLGGVLKGQELIKSAKVKAVLSDVNAYRVAILSYEDRYGNLFTNTDKYDKAITGKPKSEEMVGELIARNYIGAKLDNNTGKPTHALGGTIFLAKKGGLRPDGATNLDRVARNANAKPEEFNWALCFEGITDRETAEDIIRGIDGSSNPFDASADSNWSNGRARLVPQADPRETATTWTNERSICVELF
jgi:prepilin-type N-terminal cleavage/methylation domain-containing protein